MLWLQSNDAYDKLVELDPSTGLFQMQSRAALGTKAPAKTDGFFAILTGVFVALYKHGTELFLRLGDRVVRLESDVIVNVSGPTSRRKLSVLRGGQEIASQEYAIDTSKQFPGDLTPFVEDEDFDFGLFISNVSQAPERRDILLGRG